MGTCAEVKLDSSIGSTECQAWNTISRFIGYLK